MAQITLCPFCDIASTFFYHGMCPQCDPPSRNSDNRRPLLWDVMISTSVRVDPRTFDRVLLDSTEWHLKHVNRDYSTVYVDDETILIADRILLWRG